MATVMMIISAGGPSFRFDVYSCVYIYNRGEREREKKREREIEQLCDLFVVVEGKQFR